MAKWPRRLLMKLRHAGAGPKNQTQDLRRVHLWVSGRVQGVYFRGSARQEAEDHGLTGWIRNAEDGRVEVEVQGPSDDIERFIALCRSGPAFARVDQVQVDDMDVEPNERSFEVVA